VEDPLKAWWSRIGISVVPVFVTLGTVVFGSSIPNALGEGFSTLLYLVVILSTEIVVSFPFQTEESTIGSRALDVLLLFVVSVIWVAFVYARALFESASSLQLLLAVLAIGVASVYPSYEILKKHQENAAFWNVSKKIETNQETPVAQLTENKPTEATQDGKKINV
jgi:hypothetical protein